MGRPMATSRHLIAAAVGATVAVDRATKTAAVTAGEHVPNDGLAAGIPEPVVAVNESFLTNPVVDTAVVVFAAVVLWWAFTRARTGLSCAGAGLLGAAGIGNGLDRIVYDGAVIDWLPVAGVWANIADGAGLAGIALLAAAAFRHLTADTIIDLTDGSTLDTTAEVAPSA